MATGNEVQNNTDAPDAISIRVEELENKLEDSEELVDNMQAAEHNRKQAQKARLLVTKEKYQNSMNVMSQTRGQIELLHEQLVAQETDRRRLEGIVEYLQSIPD